MNSVWDYTRLCLGVKASAEVTYLVLFYIIVYIVYNLFQFSLGFFLLITTLFWLSDALVPLIFLSRFT